MLQNWLILLPELLFVGFIPLAFVINRYRESKTAKTFFTLSKFFLCAIILATIIFYNKSVWPNLWQNSRYSTMFKVLVYISGLVWFYLSSKWFLNKSRSSFRFYLLGMIMLLLFGLLLSAQTMLVPMLIVPLLCWSTRILILQHWDEDKVRIAARQYTVMAVVFCLLLWSGAGLLVYQAQSFAYSDIRDFIGASVPVGGLTYGAALAIFGALLFMMAAAPFHFWFVSTTTVAILPVCGFLTIIPPFVYLACLLKLISGIFAPLAAELQPLLLVVGSLSLLVGAVSANAQNNIRRLFAFSTVYNLGVMLLGICFFDAAAIVGAFVYVIIYVMGMIGVYTVFLAFKSKGDYLSELTDINGISTAKPYVSAAFLIFMISLIGVPPLLGFWGRLSLINVLVRTEQWWQVLGFLTALVLIANAYLQIIRVVYFMPRQNSFDRTDKAIYICLLVNVLLVLVSILNPAYLLHDAEIVLSGVLN
mgnify:FL=1